MTEQQLRAEWARTTHAKRGVSFEDAARMPHLMQGLEVCARRRAERAAMADGRKAA